MKVITRGTQRVWFTADQHLGHENMIRFANRPDKDARAMDDRLIDSWNEKVQPGDIVFHLGDFTLSDADAAYRYFSRLNGKIYVLRNIEHHDQRWLQAVHDSGPTTYRSRDGHVVLLPPLISLEFPQYGAGKWPLVIVLCHYPVAIWDRKHYGAIHLYGHIHVETDIQATILLELGNALPVGVDWNDGYPLGLSEVLRQFDIPEKDLVGEM